MASPAINKAILRAIATHINSEKDDTNAPCQPISPALTSHGTSGFTKTYRLTIPPTSQTSPPQTLFVKTSTSPTAATMFQGEHTSLNAIHSVVPSLCPRSIAWGPLDGDREGYFLITEFLDFSSSHLSASNPSSLAKPPQFLASKLATLHSHPAPGGHFGFPVPTACGSTIQPNPFTSSWSEFFGQHRLMAMMEEIETRRGKKGNEDLRRMVERVVDVVVPRLLGFETLGEIMPVVVHGDLWAGNKGVATILGRKGVNHHGDEGEEEDEEEGWPEEVVFDPSSTYAHHEYEHGIMNMFGGFGRGFWDEYFAIIPKMEPVGEYRDRVALYESYHHLNHFAMFGGGYKNGAMALLKPLLKKYGEDAGRR